MDTRDVLVRETNRVLKSLLIHMEELAALPPRLAGEPYAFEARRTQVMSQVWLLVKRCMRYEPSELQREQRP